ncbi:hypothetical protein P170DRAFT_506123 [Aspergillus steynii IBT 23096]|uniref:Histone chaperone domain-containing protein n=1 Tax=Aspergillus steynii IBT 23096 TaxID=1392250 RepID=A0A2I2GRQ9_9EURO|nr:uncharacterized protein P170DRAFT_506123 [Aspergillus steynii IBT 23096]PLB55555.1 hypothetical protein P170DRAFT_506123 [Aspergillus steynii IBT 23096]
MYRIQYGKHDHLPIDINDENVDEPLMETRDPDSNEQLDRDETEAIDKSNIIRGDGLRHAKPQTQNQYSEGPDEDDLPV